MRVRGFLLRWLSELRKPLCKCRSVDFATMLETHFIRKKDNEVLELDNVIISKLVTVSVLGFSTNWTQLDANVNVFISGEAGRLVGLDVAMRGY